MPSHNRVTIAAAGSGKTTAIIRDAIEHSSESSLFVTYTNNNAHEIYLKFHELNGGIPTNVTILPWFTFLLYHLARPYQSFVHEIRIETICQINGRSVPFVKATEIDTFYFKDSASIYTDKISQFACLCNERSDGLVLSRLERIFDRVYIDEVQDLAGYDLEVLELLLGSSIALSLVGDVRQATFQTNHSKKNTQYAGANIFNKFKEWEKDGCCEIELISESYRCVQGVCDLADSLFPEFPATTSRNLTEYGHSGVFTLHPDDVSVYVKKYDPQALRYSKTTKAGDMQCLNFGNSKGLGFEHVLIFPNGPVRKFLASGDLEHVRKSREKLYVAITRASRSVAFVFGGDSGVEGLARYTQFDSTQ